MQEQVADMKKKEERLEKEMAEVLQQNKSLTEPLQKATQEVSELQKQLTNYKKDKALLAVCICFLSLSALKLYDHFNCHHSIISFNICI